MHHLPRFLSPREKSAGKAAMDPRKMRQKPRLERRNAAKHIEYDVASTSSSLDDSSSSSSLITRSLDLSDRTSFRIEGVEGEFERICRSLGLSGPEDFAIPAAAWEARKNRSASDLLPRSRLKQLDTLKETVERQSDAAGAVVGELCDRVSDIVRIRNETELTRTKLTQVAELSCRASGAGNNDALAVMETTELPPSGLAESSACCVSSNYVKGIKGVRPPLLKPPPGMRQPVIDNACSTWDILRDFAPKDGITPSSVMNDRALSSSSDDEDNEKEGEEADRAIVKEEEDDMVLSESCSFTTEHEDDSSSTTTEPMSNISPNGRFKRIITYWQKGDLLGRGSFGSVYEGISDDGFFFAVKEVSLLDQGSQAKQSISQLEQGDSSFKSVRTRKHSSVLWHG
uniref:mitogen-activated protein kinase kinase kinase n=1 Tax=Citrus limon TaxID=2708 RepID=A0A1S8ACY9_CITLI